MILNAGLSLEFKNGNLFLDGVPLESSKRTREEMKDVCTSSEKPSETIYLMYRNLYGKKHEGLMAKYKMRYDITVIFPKMLGNEFAKTLGHYHSFSGNVTYPEVYEVLAGKAHFLLQKTDGNRVEDAVILEAGEGDAIIVPHGYGHITINPANEILIIADLQSSLATADYEPIKKLHGAAYFETKGGFVKNSNYTNHILRIVKASNIKKKYFGSQKPLYTFFVESPEKFDFLNEPGKFLQLMESSISG